MNRKKIFRTILISLATLIIYRAVKELFNLESDINKILKKLTPKRYYEKLQNVIRQGQTT